MQIVQAPVTQGSNNNSVLYETDFMLEITQSIYCPIRTYIQEHPVETIIKRGFVDFPSVPLPLLYFFLNISTEFLDSLQLTIQWMSIPIRYRQL